MTRPSIDLFRLRQVPRLSLLRDSRRRRGLSRSGLGAGSCADRNRAGPRHPERAR